MRIVTAAALALLLAGTAASAAETGRTVPCSEIIDRTAFPYVGSRDHRYRLVLGVVSVPPVSLPELSESGIPGWRHWRKAGIVVRGASGPVTISVPPRWRGRAGITWGNGGHGVMASVRFRACGGDRSRGNAYAGGFFLRSAAACVPLEVRVGERRATVRFGLGRRCPG